VTLCSSGSWSERREGLYALQRQLRSEQRLKCVVATETKLLVKAKFHWDQFLVTSS